MNTHNKHARAAITAHFVGPTNTKPARIKVKTQRGSAIYPYHDQQPDTGCPFDRAVAQYLAKIADEDRRKYGSETGGWGELSDFAKGILPDETRVYVNVAN